MVVWIDFEYSFLIVQFEMKINVTKTYLPDINKFKAYIDQIYKNNWLTNHGILCRTLEKKLAAYLGVKNIVLVANGTLALQIAFKVLDLKGEVITTPFSFIATTSSLVWSGLKPKFVDIDKNTFCLDPQKIERKINLDTSAILPVHVFGNTCEHSEIRKIADKHNLRIIYDAAHSFGVSDNTKSVLNYGDISILSFHATKIFHTCEGGALIINDENLLEKAKLMMDFGISGPDAISDIGINAKMNEFEAAMGLCVLDDIDLIIEERKKVYEYYISNLSKCLQFQSLNANCSYNYSYFPVVFPSINKRLLVQQELEKFNIFPRRYFYPSLNKIKYLRTKNLSPISSDISNRILCLPLYVGLKLHERNKITNIINTIVESKNR